MVKTIEGWGGDWRLQATPGLGRPDERPAVTLYVPSTWPIRTPAQRPKRRSQPWRDYTSGTVRRYKDDVKYWEVWNEFNGSFGDSKNKVADYAELVVTAYDAAKKVDPSAKIGMSVAHFDV